MHARAHIRTPRARAHIHSHTNIYKETYAQNGYGGVTDGKIVSYRCFVSLALLFNHRPRHIHPTRDQAHLNRDHPVLLVLSRIPFFNVTFHCFCGGTVGGLLSEENMGAISSMSSYHLGGACSLVRED